MCVTSTTNSTGPGDYKTQIRQSTLDNSLAGPSHVVAPDTPVLGLLVDAGADTTLPNVDGLTALELARSQRDSDGRLTPLVRTQRRRAIVAGCARVVELLE